MEKTKKINLPAFRILPVPELFLCFISIIAFLQVLYSQNTGDPGIPQMANNNFFNASGYASVVAIITIAVVGMIFASSLVYMAAQLFRMTEWEAFAKSEIYEMLISVLIAVVVFAGAVAVDEIVNKNVGGTGMFNVAQTYVQKVTCVASATTIKLEGMKMGAQYLSGMRGRLFAASYGWGMSFPLYPGFDVIERAIDLLQSFTAPFTASLYVQGIGLEVIHAVALTVALPAGILMRIFPPTRDAGSFLMASALGFYFVFPLAYVIDANVMYQLYQEQFGYAMCNNANAAGESYMYTSGNTFNSLSLQVLPKWNEDMIGTGGITDSLSYLVFQSVFLPAMTMVFVVAFIKAGAKFFSQKGG